MATSQRGRRRYARRSTARPTHPRHRQQQPDVAARKPPALPRHLSRSAGPAAPPEVRALHRFACWAPGPRGPPEEGGRFCNRCPSGTRRLALALGPVGAKFGSNGIVHRFTHRQSWFCPDGAEYGASSARTSTVPQSRCIAKPALGSTASLRFTTGFASSVGAIDDDLMLLACRAVGQPRLGMH